VLLLITRVLAGGHKSTAMHITAFIKTLTANKELYSQRVTTQQQVIVCQHYTQTLHHTHRSTNRKIPRISKVHSVLLNSVCKSNHKWWPIQQVPSWKYIVH